MLNAIEAADLGYWNLDPATNQFICNARTKSLFGLPDQEDVNLDIAVQSIHPQDRQRVVSTIQQALSHHNDGKYYCEYRIIHPVTERMTYLKAKGQAFFQDGNAYRMSGIVMDITQQKEEEVLVVQSEERLQTALRSAVTGYWDYNIPDDTTIASDELRKLLNIQPEEDFTYQTFLSRVHEQDRAYVAEQNENVLRQLDGQLELDIVFRTLPVDQKAPQWLRSKGRLHTDAEGKPVRLTGIIQDVTKEKLAQQEVVYQKAVLEAQNEAIPGGILIVDSQGEIISYNRQYVDIWKISTSLSLLQSNHMDIIRLYVMKLVDNPEEFFNNIKDVYEQFSNGLPIITTLPWSELHLTDGRVIERHGKAIIDEDGTYYGWTWYFRDITQDKKAQDMLRQKEEQFRTLANSISHLAWMVTADGWTYWYNDRWYDYTGTVFDEVEGWSWEKVNHPDHAERVLAFVKEAYQKDEPWELTYPLKSRDGSYRWFLTRAYPVKDKDGVVLSWIGTNTDIHKQLETEKALQQSEELLRQVSDFMPQIVWATNADGYHDFYNKRWYEFTGLTYEQSRGMKWSEVLHPDDYERTWQVWNQSLQTGQPYQVEYRMRRYDGEYQWLLARAFPLWDDSGTIVRWFGTCTDIHEQKLASDLLEEMVAARTQELKGSNDNLRKLNTELEQFNYIASHDLQEPLRKVRIFADRIRNAEFDTMSPSSQGIFDRLTESAERMATLLKDLLDYSSIQRKEVTQQVDLNEVIQDVQHDLELVILQKQAVLHHDKLPQVRALRMDMHRLFYNLIYNALKFSKDAEPPQVHVSYRTVPASAAQAMGLDMPSDCHYIRVADNGIGFEQDYADKVFELFKRLHGRQTYPGTGVGLALCKKVVQNYDGRIWAIATPGEGATFHILLPV
ncbi:PAS domain-containing sensor histidine kinase [Telluribacter sp. SYSU D00476]|uniref:PAS domain-containing sensor histidine kinase n=1 Tax=Telluribacter sp. SYSU D00476 TaxID=2811430 RepID=UPI001FF5749E|nr:PAS domain-containing sensor histidine kinase [Telluribacter sp. SYSU D00476]